MTDYRSILQNSHHVLLHNWPSTDVPHTLARAGYAVTVFGGPAPDDVSVTEVIGGEIVSRHTGVRREHTDLMYVYPWPGFDLDQDLPDVAAVAGELGAELLWFQSGRAADGTETPEGVWLSDAEAARIEEIARAAGLPVVHDAYIADVVRELG